MADNKQLINLKPVDGIPTASSLDVATHFGKQHKNVLQAIKSLMDESPSGFTELNFQLSEYTDATGRTLAMYNLTRDGFTLLAMGFTGKAALEWKIKYIEAFNAMEKALLEGGPGPRTNRIPQISDEERAILAYIPQEIKASIFKDLAFLAKLRPARAATFEQDFVNTLLFFAPKPPRLYSQKQLEDFILGIAGRDTVKTLKGKGR